eukprot:SAG11_NODE_16058_length_558_cov_0.555556_1_plen_57_part_10
MTWAEAASRSEPLEQLLAVPQVAQLLSQHVDLASASLRPTMDTTAAVNMQLAGQPTA